MDFWTTKDVAESCGVTVATVGRWRQEGTGPSFTKIGGRYRYVAADVRAFIENGFVRLAGRDAA